MPISLNSELLAELATEARLSAECAIGERTQRALTILAYAADAVRCEIEAAVPHDGALLLLAALKSAGMKPIPAARARQHVVTNGIPLRRAP